MPNHKKRSVLMLQIGHEGLENEFNDEFVHNLRA